MYVLLNAQLKNSSKITSAPTAKLHAGYASTPQQHAHHVSPIPRYLYGMNSDVYPNHNAQLVIM